MDGTAKEGSTMTLKKLLEWMIFSFFFPFYLAVLLIWNPEKDLSKIEGWTDRSRNEHWLVDKYEKMFP